MKRLVVIGTSDGWSSERLVEAARARGCDCVLVEPAALTVEPVRRRVDADGVELTAADAVIIKKLGEYTPELAERLYPLRYLAALGVPVFSHPEAVLRVLSRLSCTLTLAAGGVPIPPTVVTEDLTAAREAVARYGEVVIKPLYTSKARGMELLADGPGAAEALAAFQRDNPGPLYLQKRVELPDYDLGLVFLGGEYLATYARVRAPGAWNTTTASGGRYRRHEPSAELIELARRAQEPFGLSFTCVDIAETPDGPVVFEVSPFGGFRGLAETHGLDAARLYVDYVLERIDG
ncbi:MAG: GAK system ATP-grasp enzyme [Candidatus Coatesbacteria bacterium]|nr:GAK system ATP-grasp enzyme [Candidatus Coatesbacteria bacterium]